MNNVLLDTHVFIWLVNGDSTLPVKIRKLINESLLAGNVYLSVMSCWEIAMLEEKKRIILTEPCLQWIDDALRRSSVQIAELTPQITIESCKLPGQLHGDPVDRMIISTARAMHLRLITRDQSIINYGKKHHVNVLAI